MYWGSAGWLDAFTFVSMYCFCISVSTGGQWARMCGGDVHLWVWGCWIDWLIFNVCWLIFGMNRSCMGLGASGDSFLVGIDVFQCDWYGDSGVGLGTPK